MQPYEFHHTFQGGVGSLFNSVEWCAGKWLNRLKFLSSLPDFPIITACTADRGRWVKVLVPVFMGFISHSGSNATALPLPSRPDPLPISGMWYRNLDENTIPIVWELVFDGNTAFPNDELQRIIGLASPSAIRKMRFWNTSGFEFDGIIMHGDAGRIERYYRRRGFPHVQVTPIVYTGNRDWQKVVRFRIDEGPPAIIEEVQYEYDAGSEVVKDLQSQPGFQQVLHSHPMQQGNRYQLIGHSQVEHPLRTAMHRAGYIHAKVRMMARVDTTGLNVMLTIKLTPGPVVYTGNILVDGNDTARETFVLKRSGLKSGIRFQPDMLRDPEKHLSDYQLIRSAKVQISPSENDSIVDLRIRIRENKPRSLRMQAGYNRKKYLHTNVSWQHRHLPGSAHVLKTSALGSFREQRIDLSYSVPHILSHHTTLKISPFAQRRDDPGWLIHRLGFQNQLMFHVKSHVRGRIDYERTWHRTSDHLKGNVSVFRLSANYAGPDNAWLIQTVAEFSGLVGNGSLQYNRYSLKVRRNIIIGPQSRLAIRQSAGFLDATKELRLPGDLRFTSGGVGSVRGWMHHQLGPRKARTDDAGQFLEYVPVGGRTLLEFSIEYIRKLHDRMDAALFLDGGNVWRHPSNIYTGGIRYGLGGGLRYEYFYNTQLQVFIARKLNPSETDLNIHEEVHYGNWTDLWGFHFSIDRTF